MIKNNKGFTLVEVVAVVALLGILSMFVFPKIFDLVEDSRKKIYLEDASRLVSKAQYVMNANSNSIEKPSKGEMIIFSMKYLSEGDFESTPNGGMYLNDYSFVAVKNYEGKYIYSVMLTERTSKDDYRGLELCTEQDLIAKGGIKHVKVFQANELIYVEENSANAIEGAQTITGNYVTSKLSGSDSRWGGTTTLIGLYTSQ